MRRFALKNKAQTANALASLKAYLSRISLMATAREIVGFPVQG